MRPSIKKIFNNWKVLMGIMTLLIAAAALTIAEEQYVSFEKVSNLNKQKGLVHAISTLGRSDLELAAIQYRGKSTQLTYEHEKLLALNSYDIIGTYLLDYAQDYKNDLDELKSRSELFIKAVESWYDPNTEKLDARESEMLAARSQMFQQIDMMVIKDNLYQHENFIIQRNIVYAALFFCVIVFLVFLKRFSDIQKDINSLYVVEAEGEPHTILTEEIDIIAKRMARKPRTSDNPTMLDPVTGINNYKGLIYAFANKKGSKESPFVGVCVFEVDGIREIDKKYPKSFTQSALKKIAFMISLYEQHNDIIARSEYGQFTVILFRQSKEQAMSDCNTIRTSVEEAVFKVPQGETLKLTLTGAFIIKQSNMSIDEAIEQGRSILKKAHEIGTNRILQVQDVM